jgi:uncharacterized protein (TIGR02996 family)
MDTSSPLRQALEEAIVANPDDTGAHAAYADHLSEQGDPRGEFIQVQLALEDPDRSEEERQRLKQREKELFDKHGREWLGELAPYLIDHTGEDTKGVLLRGWVDTIEVSVLTVDLARALIRAPQARLLRRLVIYHIAHADDHWAEPGADVPVGVDYPAPHMLLGAMPLGNLRVFQLGDLKENEQGLTETCFLGGDYPIIELVQKMPRLEELYLAAHNIDTDRLFALSMPHLRVLHVYHMNHYPLERLAQNASLGRLTHLFFHPHALEPGRREAYLRLSGVRAVINSPHLQSLAHLRLRLCDMGDDGCREIVRSGILNRLRTLDVMFGRITDEGARVLAACPDFRHLEELNISWNRLTDAGLAALQATGVVIVNRGQYRIGRGGWLGWLIGPSPDDYLYQGDME